MSDELKVESAEEAEVREHCEQAFKAIRLARRPRRTWRRAAAGGDGIRSSEFGDGGAAHLRGCPPERDEP